MNAERPSRHGLRRGVAALIGAVALLGSAACAGGTPARSPSSTPPVPTPAATATGPTAATGDQITVPVYYATELGTDIMLAREQRTVPDAGGPGPTAVATMLAGGPLDPDYTGLWNSAATVLGVTQSAGLITVDLSAEAATADVGTRAAEVAVQGLVYTVTDALGSTDPVRILVAGQPVDELFGVVSVADPVSRAEPLGLRFPVQIDTPNEGGVVSGTFTVSGDAAVFEATLPWRIEGTDGSVVQKGVASTAEGQTFSPYSFEVTLDPGTYVVVITEDDPSDGEGRAPATDTRTITVR